MSSITNSNSPSSKQPKHVFVFDYMRTRSNLFWRWMSTHPALYSTHHPFLMAGFMGPQRIVQWTKNSEARKADLEAVIKFSPTDETYESSTRQLEREIENAESEGKILFTNEHVISFMKRDLQLDLIRKGDEAFPTFDKSMQNPMEVPDALLHSFMPMLLIRHPILQVDSVYRSMTANSQCRPGDEDFDLITGTGHSRWLFEYFKHTRGGVTPMVVEGEDVLYRTKELGRNICLALGLEPDGLKDEWQPIPEERRHQNFFVAAMTATMNESTGIERPEIKPDEPNIEQAVIKWSQRYGTEVAKQLKERVDRAMPHYEYLVQFKL